MLVYAIFTRNRLSLGGNIMIDDLRTRIEGEEFDYQTLVDSLKQYERPRDKITKLLRQGAIIRVKKGIYVFGKKYARRPFSREILANMIYGPSCISLDFALHYHGLIPERVEAVTSVTSGRGRRFITPVGLFIYRQIPPQPFAVGVDRVQLEDGHSFLIAVPEKALADKIQEDRGTGIRSQAEMQRYLIENLRIDAESLEKLKTEILSILAERYRSRKLRLLNRVIARLQMEGGRHE
jgi:predicted transcriptional regulator of viral defense system